MERTSRIVAVTATLVASTLLSGCAVDLGRLVPDLRPETMQAEETKEFSGADIMFAQMMIPHHQQAVDMGTIAESLASSQEVRDLAEKIKAEQAPEIIQMESWLEKAGASNDMGHDMGLNGMLSEAQMAELMEATGADFDRLFLIGMIAHHKGAILMAQMVTNSKNEQVKQLAEGIVSSQNEEIKYMEELLSKL